MWSFTLQKRGTCFFPERLVHTSLPRAEPALHLATLSLELANFENKFSQHHRTALFLP